MLRRFPLAALLTISALTLAPEAGALTTPEYVETDHVTVRLVVEHRSIEPGRPVHAGLQFDMAEGWHVYWRDPGDSGEPPRVQWDLPAGFEAGPLAWPTPERLVTGPIVNYVYEDEVLLPARIEVPADLPVGFGEQLAADVSWLVCRAEECIPGKARLALELPVAAELPEPDPQWAAAFASARATIPPDGRSGAAAGTPDAAVTPDVRGTRSLALVLLLAFGGGLLLNLMPCVFPVLSLKVLGFVEQSHNNPHRIRAHGWTFTLGVVVSFWVLAGALLALRAGGEQLGWGFQLQSPVFVAILAALLLVLALSLSGVFELGLQLTTIGVGAGARTGYAGSFWTGALATVVATPCTAPLMGPALGYALTQPAATSLLVFTALAFGMAAPYLALAHFPRTLARLPRPGAWMETLRQLMAFPLYATVLWLVSVFSRQAGDRAMWQLLAGLLVVAMAAWMMGLAQRRGSTARVWAMAAPVVAVAGLVLGLSAVRSPVPAGAEADEFWAAWSPERVSELRSAGTPVFVNFTADWCLSCQVNERVVFASDGVRDLFRRYGVAALKADWTNEDERISRALADFGREGVPLYVLYPGRSGTAPHVLPQVPTHSALAEAFASTLQTADPIRSAKNERS